MDRALSREDAYQGFIEERKTPVDCGVKVIRSVFIIISFVAPFFLSFLFSCPFCYLLKNKISGLAKIFHISEKIMPLAVATFFSFGVASFFTFGAIILVYNVIRKEKKRIKNDIQRCENTEFIDRFCDDVYEARQKRVDDLEKKKGDIYRFNSLEEGDNFLNLPNELVRKILNYLDFATLESMLGVNEYFYYNTPFILYKMCKRLFNEITFTRKKILKSYIDIHSKNKKECYEALKLVIKISKNKSEEFESFNEGRMGIACLQGIAQGSIQAEMHNLFSSREHRLERAVKIKYDGIKDHSPCGPKIFKYFTFLNLKIMNIRGRNFSVKLFSLQKFPKLEILKINRPKDVITKSNPLFGRPDHEEGFFCFLNPIKVGFSHGYHINEKKGGYPHSKRELYDNYRDLLSSRLKVLYIKNEGDCDQKALKDVFEFFLYVPSLEKAFFKTTNFNAADAEEYFRSFTSVWERPQEDDGEEGTRVDVFCENVFQTMVRRLNVTFISITENPQEVSLTFSVFGREKEIIFIIEPMEG